MTIVQLLAHCCCPRWGWEWKIVHPGGPTPGPKYSYMGHVLSLLCAVINDQRRGAQLMIS